MGDAGKVGEDHAEAVVEGDGDAEPVLLGKAHALADDVPVVEDGVVREDNTFGKARGPAGVLDVDRVVERERLAPLDEFVAVDLLGPLQEVVPGEHAVVDRVAQGR